uniref:Palmdelphin n=1 Tax=Sphenodon punctatus TaxID=8508 RepID=A0A8D0L6G3_SPHPU
MLGRPMLQHRFQPSIDKRKLQEEISQKRLTVEEEKLKHQHLKKKALREKWLLDGLSALTPKEKEEIQRQNHEDQQRTKELEQNIHRLEKEIEELEKEELRISTNEVTILKKLKSVERTAEDIIRVKPVDYIYANIPDLPKSFRPSALKRAAQPGTDDDEDDRRALFTMEIKVEKDMKTGESIVLSTIPLPSDDFKGTGVKVYDDGRKSVYAVCPTGNATKNGVNELAPVEVEDLLRQATEKNSKSPTEYHEPVYANQFCRPETPHKDQLVQGPNCEETIKKEANELGTRHNEFSKNKEDRPHSGGNGLALPKVLQPKPHSPGLQRTERTLHISPQSRTIPKEERVEQINFEPLQRMRDKHHEVTFRNSENTNERPPKALEDNEDVRYSIVKAVPCYVDDTEPVTMVFMGYQRVDDDDEIAVNKNLSGYDGIIHAELVVIDDDEDDDSKSDRPSYHPVGHYSQVYQPPSQAAAPQTIPEDTVGENRNKEPYKNSISLQEQEASLGSPVYHAHLDGQVSGDGTEDPSLTALRMRMAKLGKRVI